jgi:hypothetical protein
MPTNPSIIPRNNRIGRSDLGFIICNLIGEAKVGQKLVPNNWFWETMICQIKNLLFKRKGVIKTFRTIF